MYETMNRKKQIQQLVFENTPIDTIIATYDLPNGIEVIGCEGGDTLIYRLYDNGMVVEK